MPADTAREREQRGRTFNGLTAREWTRMSRNVWNDLSSPRDARHLEHGAVFPVKLADRLVRMFSAPGDLVVDPFAGVGSTLVAAVAAGRRALGIELSPRFAELAREWCGGEADVVTGDARDLRAHVGDGAAQLAVTSPPYADFIQRSVRDRATSHKTSRLVERNGSRVKPYSDDPRDLGGLPYDEFLPACAGILADLRACTRPGGYAVWVVKDHRLPPERPYVPLHSDLARAAEACGWLWHDLIVWDQNEQRSLVLLGYPTRFYTNQNCSFLVVLRNPAG